jgi:hypothetical protein
MAMGVLGVLTMTGTTVVYFANTNARSATYSKSNGVAFDLAEAGLAQALAILQGSLQPMTPNLLAEKTVQYPEAGGSATFSGVLSGTTWTITATGKATNPNGGNDVTRRLTRTVTIYGLAAGGTVSAWSRIYQDASSCLTITDVTVTAPIASKGGICLVGSAKITGADTTVEAGGNVVMTGHGTQNVDENAGAGANSGSGTSWSNTSNITSSNNSDASVSLGSSATSKFLDATSFGFSIPSNATINGIVARVERAASSSGRIRDQTVQLLDAGAGTGSNKAGSSTWGTSDSTITYGSSSDLWGTTWTPAQINASNFGLHFQARNTTSSTTTATVDYMEITVYYTVPPDTSIGTVGTPVALVGVSGTCKYDTQTAHTPCSDVDKVYGTDINTTPAGLSKPQVDMAYWYENAMPGPKHNCTTGSFPNTFDNDTVRNNSLPQNGEMTPTNSSYTCQVRDVNNNLLGEISWNYQTHVLTIHGTIFIDGNYRFDDDGQVVHYQGRGIIYASGDLEFDELVCAGGSGTSSCVTQSGGMGNWDPSQNMMIVLADGWAEFDQGSSQSQSVPSGLQGLIYSNDECLVHENFHLSGPIVCDTITLPSAGNGWPTYYPWPDLGTLVDGQVYMSPDTATDHLFVLGPQNG